VEVHVVARLEDIHLVDQVARREGHQDVLIGQHQGHPSPRRGHIGIEQPLLEDQLARIEGHQRDLAQHLGDVLDRAFGDGVDGHLAELHVIGGEDRVDVDGPRHDDDAFLGREDLLSTEVLRRGSGEGDEGDAAGKSRHDDTGNQP